VHGFTTERYLREVTLPALDRGFVRAGRQREDFELSCPVFIVTGRTDEEQENADIGTRRQIAFYGSTPAYRGVLELHGWGDLQPELNSLSKQGKWAEMGELIDDDVLGAFAVVGRPDEVAAQVLARYRGVIDRLSFYLPYQIPEDALGALLEGFRAA